MNKKLLLALALFAALTLPRQLLGDTTTGPVDTDVTGTRTIGEEEAPDEAELGPQDRLDIPGQISDDNPDPQREEFLRTPASTEDDDEVIQDSEEPFEDEGEIIEDEDDPFTEGLNNNEPIE